MEFINKLLSNASVLEAVFSLIVLAVTTFLLPALHRLLKIKADDKSREYLENALRGALQAAFIGYQAGAISPGEILTNQKVQDDLLAFAQNYLKEKVPDALNRLGIDDHGLSEILLSRLPEQLKVYSDAYHKIAGDR